MSLQFAHASHGGPSYFLPSSYKSPSVGHDYRAGLIHDLVNKLQRCFNLAAPDRVVDQMLAQFVGLGFSDPISLTSRAADYAAQMEAIERLKAAPANWSMAEAIAPSDVQALVARDALIAMMLAALPAPRVMLLDGGTLGAYWKRDGMYASIDFDEDGEFPWTVADGNMIGSGIWSITQPVPQQLRTALRA
jgi:hypothetical protein